MATNLQNQFIDESYQKLVQVSGSYLADGTGSTITDLNLNVVSASYAATASKVLGSIESASFATTASYAINGGTWDGQFSGSAGITGSTTFLGNEGITILNDSNTGAVKITPGPDYVTKFTDATLTGIGIIGASQLSSSFGLAGWTDNKFGLQVKEWSPVADRDIRLTHGTNYASFTSNGATGITNLRGDTVLVQGSSSLDSGVSFEVKGDVTASAFTGDGSAITGVVSASHALIADFALESVQSTEAANTTITVRNVSGGEIQKGTPLYVTDSGTSSTVVGVLPADAGNHDLMPATAIAAETISNNSNGIAFIDGLITGVPTSDFNNGDEVYVGVGGGFTNVAPTGSNNHVQHLGNVTKIHASNGAGVINMSGEDRHLPNLAEGLIWVGNSTNGEPTAQSTASFAKIDKNNTFTGTQAFNNIAVNGTGSFAYIQSVTGSAKIIGDSFIQLNTDTPAQRYGGLKVIDSGSAVTASFQWDGEKDIWMQVEADGTSAAFLTGLSGSLGTEALPTKNTIVKGGGAHTLTDSSLTDNGALVIVSNPLTVTGTITGNVTGNLTGTATAATSASHALLSDNLVPGDLSHNGLITQTTEIPGRFGEKDFFTVTDASASLFHIGLQDYTPFGEKFIHQGYVSEIFDSTGFNYGSAMGNSLTGVGFFLVPSGSSAQNTSLLAEDNGDGTGLLKVTGHEVNIQGYDDIVIQGNLGQTSGRSYSHVTAITVASSTGSLNCSLGNMFTMTISGDTLLEATNLEPGQTISVKITNGGTHTLTFQDTFEFAGGTAPTLTSNGTDVFTFITFDGTSLQAAAVQNFS